MNWKVTHVAITSISDLLKDIFSTTLFYSVEIWAEDKKDDQKQ